jgi:hypothetical protein
MSLEPPKRKIIYIGDEAPDGDPKYFGWIDTATRTGKAWENGEWVVKIDFNTVGYTGTFRVANKELTFHNGLLVKYE